MKIYQSIVKIMSEVGGIEKTRSGNGISYKFRGIEDVFTNFHPLLIKNSVFCAPKVIKESTEIFQNKSGNTSFRVTLTIEHVFYADDGSNVSVTTCGEGIDTSDKATNKAMSSAFKYAFFELFCVPTAQVDDSDYENISVDCDDNSGKKVSSISFPGKKDKDFDQTNFDQGMKNDPNYICQAGKKYFGMKLSEIGFDNVMSYGEYLLDSSSTSGKPLTGKFKEFVDMGALFIAPVRYFDKK